MIKISRKLLFPTWKWNLEEVAVRNAFLDPEKLIKNWKEFLKISIIGLNFIFHRLFPENFWKEISFLERPNLKQVFIQKFQIFLHFERKQVWKNTKNFTSLFASPSWEILLHDDQFIQQILKIEAFFLEKKPHFRLALQSISSSQIILKNQSSKTWMIKYFKESA